MADNLLRLAKSHIARSTNGFVLKKIREENMTVKERENITELNNLIEGFREDFQGKPDTLLASPEVVARKVGIARRVYKQTQVWKLFMVIAIEPTDFTIDVNKSMVGKGITPNRLSPAKRYVRTNELIVNESDSEFSDDLEDPRETTSVAKTLVAVSPTLSNPREVPVQPSICHKSLPTEVPEPTSPSVPPSISRIPPPTTPPWFSSMASWFDPPEHPCYPISSSSWFPEPTATR